MQITPERQVVVIAPNYWGVGADEVEAKASLKKLGGRLNRGYTIVEFDPAVFDEFEVHPIDGGLSWWTDPGIEPGSVRPKITEVTANGRRAERQPA